jgi:hypothetical protein
LWGLTRWTATASIPTVSSCLHSRLHMCDRQDRASIEITMVYCAFIGSQSRAWLCLAAYRLTAYVEQVQEGTVSLARTGICGSEASHQLLE